MLSAWILLLLHTVCFPLRLGNSGSFPRPLKAEEEREYLARYAQGDLEARNKLVMDVISVDDDMLETLDTRDSCAKVRQCVEHCLSEREAKVISLRYGLDGEGPRTQREIATACGISRSYV